MSGFLAGLVWKADLPRDQKYILVALADHGQDDGTRIFPSIRQTALKVGASERTVQRHINKLLRRGILEVVRESGFRRPTEYRINVDNLAFVPELMPVIKGSPVTEKGDTSDAQRRVTRVTPVTEKGDTGVARRVTPVTEKGDTGVAAYNVLNVIETSLEPSIEQEPDPPLADALFEHEFGMYETAMPKIGGKFLNRELAKSEFRRAYANRMAIIRGATNYGKSQIVKRCQEQGGQGIKFPNNFIRDGTFWDWQTPEVVESEEDKMQRDALIELTVKLKSEDSKDGIRLGDLSPPAKNLFLSLNTPWYVLRRLALTGKDIRGPQTEGLVDAKMLAAEGGSGAL